jgi:hypothetical protein
MVITPGVDSPEGHALRRDVVLEIGGWQHLIGHESFTGHCTESRIQEELCCSPKLLARVIERLIADGVVHADHRFPMAQPVLTIQPTPSAAR